MTELYSQCDLARQLLARQAQHNYRILFWFWLLNALLLVYLALRQWRIVRQQSRIVKEQARLDKLISYSFGAGPKITCPDCLYTSYNRNDVFFGWCGNCHKQTSEGCQGL